MTNKIFLEWPITVHKTIRNSFLKNITDKLPFLHKILFRLPQKIVYKIYRDDYTVTERIFERGFLFMNTSDLSLNSKILDIGCSWSSISMELSCLGFKVWAIDIDEYPFYHPNLTFIKEDICNVNFEENFFDLITAISTIEHIGLGHYGDNVKEDGDIKAMQNIRKFLKPDGKLILTLPYGKKAKTEVFRVYDKEALTNLIQGFKIIKSYYLINVNDKYWQIASEEEASKQGINERGRNKGNVCLVLKKI